MRTTLILAVLAGCSGCGKGDDTVAVDTDADADTDTDADGDADTDADADGDADTDADSDADADTDTTPTGDTGPSWLLPSCPANPPDDTVLLFDPATQITVTGDELLVTFGYGCGCTNHVVGTCFGDDFGSGATATLEVYVLHEANGEMCEAFCYDEVRVDLLPVQQQFAESYAGAPSGTVDLAVGWRDAAGPQVQVVPYTW